MSKNAETCSKLPLCWGAELQGGDNTKCIVEFLPGSRQFKNRFCENCCNGTLKIASCNVFAVNEEISMLFQNKRSGGLWSTVPKHLGTGKFRVVNNTLGCKGPALVVFSDGTQVNGLVLPQLPAGLSEEGVLQMSLYRRTLVPTKTMCHAACSSPRNTENEHVDYSDALRNAEQLKAEKRALSNRMSAAKTRERKRSRISTLEAQIFQMEREVNQLRKENNAIKVENEHESRDIMDAINFLFDNHRNATDFDL